MMVRLGPPGLPESKFLRFCFAGAIGFVIDGGLVQILSGILGFDLIAMRLIAFTIAVTATWQINRRITFPDARYLPPWRQWLQYFLANSLGAGVNLLTYTILVINSAFLARWPILAVLAGSAVGLAINFTLSARFVFAATQGADPEARRRQVRIAMTGLALAATVFVAGATTKNWQPVADEAQYLSYAYNLFHHGVYSQAAPSQPPVPSAGREPGYPAFIAAMMAVDPGLRRFSPDCLVEAQGQTCDPATYDSLQWANAVLMGLAALLAGLTTMRLTGSFGAGLVTGGAIVLNAEALSWRYTMLSDYLALMLAALLTWLAVSAFRRPSVTRWGLAGLTLAGLILTKAVYLYFLIAAGAIFVVAAIAIRLLRRNENMPTIRRAALAFFLAASLPVLGWMSFNKSATGVFSITDGTRMGLALSVREIYNDMTPGEWATSFLWWTRGFGDNLARRHLPDEYTARLHDSAPGGFYQRGHDRFYEMRDALMQSEGLSRDAAEQAVTDNMISRIAARPFKHMATTVPLFYRGIWIDEFIVLSLPALLFVLITAWRRRDAVLAIAFTPGIFSLAIYSVASLNIPRYQLTAVPTLALALGLTFAMIYGGLGPSRRYAGEIRISDRVSAAD